MRGESSDVIEGKAVEDSGGHSEKTNTTTHSPPLSAAASQVSLATSDLTTSDPDLALESSASSFTSSRPPSSSDVISPDLGLPNIDDDRTETVISPDLGIHHVDDDRTETEISPDLGVHNMDDDRTETVISPDLGLSNVDDDRTETFISPDLGVTTVDDDRTEIVISTDLGLPNVDNYTTETDTLTTQSNPVRSVMAGGGSSFMNELNSALRKHSHTNKPDHNKPDAPDKIDDTTDKISDKIDNDHRVPPSPLPIYPGVIFNANSLSLEGKLQRVKRKYDDEHLPELDFEPEVGMVVLSHQAAKHKLSVKPKRKYESHRPRKRFQEQERNILNLSVSDSNSQNLQEKDIASSVMPTSLPSSISPQNRLVDCPESPLPQTEEGQKKSGVCFAPDIKVFSTESVESNGIYDESTKDASVEKNENISDFKIGTKLLGVPPEEGPPSLGPQSGPPSLGFDVEMEDEDYFEEFHLPNNYENAFVRHKSFRRKVNLAPIDAPDADRIEGLIVAGEFERHGSIRRKLVPEDENKNKLEKRLSDISSNSENDSISTEISGVFGRDLEEIQEMLNEESNDNLEDIDTINDIDSVNHNKELSDKDISNVTSSDVYKDSEIQDLSELSEETESQIPVSKLPIKRTNTSTPKSNSTSSYTSAMLDKDLSSMSEGETPEIKGEPFLSFEEENMSIEHSTLVKIQECRDFTRYKDMYNLTGRIQDILSPEEMKEVIENADRYREYLNQDIIDVLHQSLSLSLDEQTTETNTIDSGISSPKRTTIDVKSDLRSVFEGSNESVDVENKNESKESGHEVNENESKENINNEEDLDTVFVFERKRSLRILKSNSDNETDEVEVEAVFVESDNSPRNMKRLAAPAMDFSTGSEDFDGSHDISVFSNEPPITDLDTPYLPNIVLTNTDGYRGDVKQDNDSCANLLLYDTPSGASEALSPFDLGSHSFTLPLDTDRPASTDSNGSGGQRKLICVTKDILNSPNEDDNISISSMCSEGFSHEDTIGSISDEILGISDKVGINSPRRSHGSDGYQHSSPESQTYEEPPLPPSPYKTKGEGEDPIPSLPPFIPELTAMEESMEDRHWRSVVVGGAWRRIDMKVIAPYRKCLHHGGYMSENNQAIIVFSSCYLPSSSRRDYNYVMDNLFLYVLSTLEQLIADDYVLIYLAGGCPKNSVPSFKWLKRAYQMVDHKLRKNLQALHVVHPTMWVKTIVALTRPFVSSKFYRKLSFINNLTELAQVVPLDQLEIPDTVQQADFELMIREKKRNLGRHQGGYFTSPRKGPLSPTPSISAMSPTRGVWSPIR